jgi:hypothetical protein
VKLPSKLAAAIQLNAGRRVMAKKARKKSIAKTKKAKRTKTKIRKAKAKSKTVIKKKPAQKPRWKVEPKGITEKVVSVFHTVVDTVKETDALRNKMEPTGTSETS